MKKLLAGASLLPFLCAGVAAHAADATPAANEVTEVIVTGTRQVGVKAEDSAAPIQVVGARNLTLTGATELAQSLATSVPSLNIQQNGGDAAAVNIQAALRGISPNDTLILVDGKRRHGTANLAVDGGSPYSGAATTSTRIWVCLHPSQTLTRPRSSASSAIISMRPTALRRVQW